MKVTYTKEKLTWCGGNKRMTIWVIFAVGILMGAFGALLMKVGASHIGVIELQSFSDAMTFLVRLFTNFSLMAGMALYFLSAVAWSYLLTKLDVSFVQPILALTYVVTPILAMFFLSESIPASRWVGIVIIIVGVFVVAKTAAA